jgi:TolB protein
MTESNEDPAAAPEAEGDPAPRPDGAQAPEDPLELDDAAASERELDDTRDAPTSATRRRLRAAVALTLIAAIIVFGALGGARLAGIPSETPSPTPHPARLVAIDASGALATMDGLGGAAVPYLAPGVQFGFPAWSPDGTHVAATGQGAGSGVIHVFAVPPPGSAGAAPGGASAPATTATPADAGSPAATGVAADESGVIYRSSDSPPFYLYWTPDSRQVGFLTQEANGISLRIAPADGSVAATTIRQGAPLYWDWVDSGRLLAHIGGSAPDAFVGEVGLDGRSIDATVITPDTSLSPSSSAAPDTAVSVGVFRSPAVSRDGRYRAYVDVTSAAAEEIVLEARDGSSRRTLAVPGATAVEFDPSGDSLAYVAPIDAAAQPQDLPLGPLRLMDPTSGSSRTLLGGTVVGFFWAPDGKTIAALELPAPGNNGVQAAAPRFEPAMARLTSTRARSPQAIDAAAGIGLHLAFVDVAAAAVRSQRDIQVSLTFVNQILPYFDQYALSHRFWSADSASLALPLVTADGTDQLTVIPASGTDPHPIPGLTIGFWSP